jgi:hypothetical protein
MLKLERRTAKLGPAINTRTQKHGAADVTALDIPLGRIALTKEELCEVMLDDQAYKHLYISKKKNPDEPRWGQTIGDIVFKGKVTGVVATLFLGRRQLRVIDAKLSKVRVQRNSGGLSWWDVQLQCVPDLDESHPVMENLFARLNQEIEVELEIEHYGAQPQLPLEDEEEDDSERDDDKDEEPPKAVSGEQGDLSEMGRRIAAAARKKRGGKKS